MSSAPLFAILCAVLSCTCLAADTNTDALRQITAGQSAAFPDLEPATPQEIRAIGLLDGSAVRGKVLKYTDPLITVLRPDKTEIVFPAGLLADDEIVALFPETRFADLITLRKTVIPQLDQVKAMLAENEALPATLKKIQQDLEVGLIKTVSERDALRARVALLERELADLKGGTRSGPPPASPAKWIEVQRFSGNGNMRTPGFHISSPDWRLRYVTAKTESDLDVINFSVDVKGPEEFLAFNETKPGKGVTSGKKPGDYWLDVSALFCSWNILIEEQR